MIGAIFPESTDTRVDEPRIDFAHGLVVDAKAMFHPRAVILHDHIRFRGEALEDRDTFGAFQIQREAAPVALQILKIGAVAFVERSAVAVLLSRLFDFQDVGAPIRELARRGGAGAGTGKIQHGETGERALAR